LFGTIFTENTVEGGRKKEGGKRRKKEGLRGSKDVLDDEFYIQSILG
jgi:hypothetical protein